MRVSLGLLAKGLVWSFCLSSVFILWGHLQGRRTEWNVERSQIPEISARFDVREARQEVNTGPHRSQQEAIARFCSSHEKARQVDMYQSYKHLMYDDKYKMLYCFVPKGGCTSLKPVFEYLHGLIDANQTLDRHDIHGANTHKTLLSRLSRAEREKRLKTYYKIMILRDPLERMMSAYKDKLEVPLSSDKRLKDHNKGDVARFLSPDDHKLVLKEVVSKGNAVPYVSFTDFMTYLSREKLSNLDQHFMPMYHLCNPCAVNYTFYGNFHSLTDDIHQALREVGAPEWLYQGRSEHSMLSVKDMMELYFGQLSPEKRTRLKEEFKSRTGYTFEAAPKEDVPRSIIQAALDKFKTEFDFYSSLFPNQSREYANLHY
jgi:hypothetical protein